MATYQLNVVNEHFQQSGSFEAEGEAKAWQKALQGAIDIAKDQVSHGNPFFGAELTLKQGKTVIGRWVVSVGASPLKE